MMVLLAKSPSEVEVGWLAYNVGGTFMSLANELVSGSWRSRYIGRCSVCGRWYGSGRCDKKTCSDACRMKLSRAKKPDYGKERLSKMVATKAAKVFVKTCECCGQEFMVSGLNSAKKYCSGACKQRIYRRRNHQLDTGRICLQVESF